MKTFKEFTLSEENTPFEMTGRGVLDVDREDVRDNINVLLNGVTSQLFPNPYVALERVKKVLANFHIFLEKTTYMTNDHGFEIWPVSQFGEKVGMDDDGNFKRASVSPYYVFFEYAMSDVGGFIIYCELVNQEDMEELKDAVNSEEMVNEESEQLTELSKNTLKRYAKKAANDIKSSEYWGKQAIKHGDKKLTSKIGKRIMKRSKYLKKAENKINEVVSRTPHTDLYYLWKQRKRRRLGD